MTKEVLNEDIHSQRFTVTSENLIILAVSLSLFGGRWISYIGFPNYNLFLVDLFYFFGLLGIVIFQKKSFNSKNTILITFILTLFISFQIFRNLNLPLITRLRDLVPFLYLIATPVIIRKFPETAWIRTIKVARYATLFGAIWTDLVLLGILKEFSALQQFSGVPIFSARWDHSGISLCIGLLLWGSFPRAKLRDNTLVRLFLLSSILLQYSRASYVGLFFVLLSIYFVAKSRKKIDPFQKTSFLNACLALSIVAIPILTLVAPMLPQKSALSRIGIENLFSPGKLIQDTRNSGTANARIESQKLLTGWIYQNQLEFLGAGPGREMVLESKAYVFLSGARDVRSPHSWFYGNFGRFGYLGLIMWHLICFSYIRAQRARLQVFDFPANILIVIYIIALFGVVMESPFGILPFSFFLGGGKLLDLSKDD
ncbi:hypothetical protein B1s21122_04805 [Candidatus Nanopelagicus limnes]|uniref:O-antigen ligase-related domain-containing protein n=1 Tax=Candidatus Nanopelagicus limnae TaxID=1884634 RepID=A0A249JYN0_9ACTN|nr:O-antigen ligase family protein [Candidatus Nanopelagicus limnes]ASY09643.1 hypothetical protein B1s21122_04805 [Candidatus Nanopelagicus limnes]